ncbi:MAG: hypothetical protein M3O09_09250 [Acidobacteriota bacterium]|jgi:hypothetical protein|nr:hypothetical protein [Acidobacteriota bacterium]
MLLRIAILLSLLAPALPSNAQSYNVSTETVVMRFAYHTTYEVDWADSRYPHVCLALYRGGYYRLSRMTKDGGETLQGKISENQLHRVIKMAQGLRPQTRDGGLLYRGAESFAAEVVRGGTGWPTYG